MSFQNKIFIFLKSESFNKKKKRPGDSVMKAAVPEIDQCKHSMQFIAGVQL